MKKTCLVETDLSGAEWMVTAYCTGDPRMIETANASISPHVMTGELISGAPASFIEYEEALVGHLTDASTIAKARRDLPELWEGNSISEYFLPRIMSIRQCGKKSNHGLNYRLGKQEFGLHTGLSESDAEEIIFLYREVAYPGLTTWYSEIEEELKTNDRTLTNCYGQSARFLDKWDHSLFQAATAFIPQSTVGNITNRGMRGVYHYGSDAVHLAAQVHDSILTHHSFDSYEELQSQLIFVDNCMTHEASYRDVPFTIKRDQTIGVNWGQKAMNKISLYALDSIQEAYELSNESSST